MPDAQLSPDRHGEPSASAVAGAGGGVVGPEVDGGGSVGDAGSVGVAGSAGGGGPIGAGGGAADEHATSTMVVAVSNSLRRMPASYTSRDG